jgi:hypothetical protein
MLSRYQSHSSITAASESFFLPLLKKVACVLGLAYTLCKAACIAKCGRRLVASATPCEELMDLERIRLTDVTPAPTGPLILCAHPTEAVDGALHMLWRFHGVGLLVSLVEELELEFMLLERAMLCGHQR